MAGDIQRRPAVPPSVRVRRNVKNLKGDPILTFYEKAIGVLKTRGLDDPTGWRYQAAIHDYPLNTSSRQSRSQGGDPKAADGDVLPASKDMNTFWRQCQHGGWFFASWHRMYLHFFEKLIAREVAKLNGPTDWALPYWNYSASDADAILPEPFRNPGIISNNLWVQERDPRANAGQPFLDFDRFGRPDPNKPDTNLRALTIKAFGGPLADGPSAAFEGPKVVHHEAFGNPGGLESAPHNGVHASIGGFMGGFSSAPLDPIFWSHHCNIDRLWEVWLQRQKHLGTLVRNPKLLPEDLAWLARPWDFHDESGNPAQMTSLQTLNTRAAPLSYEYEDTADPFNGAP
jgi:tyrosinase